MISYFGGKNKMAEWIFPFIPRTTQTYVEPFSGAFWVHMNIKADYSHIDTIVYNDINKHMVNLYACMREYDTFLKEFDKAFDKGGLLYNSGDIDKYKEDMKALYYQYKKDKSEGNFLDNPPTERPDFEAGVKYAFLITSAFNACYPRAAGCSAFSKDRLKINALLNKLNDERYQQKLERITNIENLDFEKLINKYDGEDTFFYLDPPYEDKDNKRLDWYGVGEDNAFGRASHERLCKMLSNTKAKWALSYYYFDELEEWLPKDKYRWEYKEFFRSSASFSDSKDEKGVEVLIMNYDMDDDEYKENATYFKGVKKIKKKVKSHIKKEKKLVKEIQIKNNFKHMITEQQFLVLFDIAKSAMNVKGGFAGYSNEAIMKLMNELIAQQNNTELIDFVKPDAKEEKKSKKKTAVKVEAKQTPEDFEVFGVEEKIIEDDVDFSEINEETVEETVEESDDDDSFWD